MATEKHLFCNLAFVYVVWLLSPAMEGCAHFEFIASLRVRCFCFSTNVSRALFRTIPHLCYTTQKAPVQGLSKRDRFLKINLFIVRVLVQLVPPAPIPHTEWNSLERARRAFHLLFSIRTCVNSSAQCNLQAGVYVANPELFF